MDAALRMCPNCAVLGSPLPPPKPPPPPIPPSRLTTEPCAIASLTLGVLGLVFFGCIGLAISLAGLILGYVGLARIDAGRSEGRALAWAGIGLSGLALIVAILAVMAFGAFLASFAAPGAGPY